MFNAKNINSEIKSGGSKIPAGIHLKVELTGVEVDGNFIEFNVRDSEGRVQNDRIWFPDKDKTSARGDKTAEQVFEDTVNSRLQRITQYLRVFLTDDELGSFNAATFTEYAQKAAAVINQRKKAKELNLKLVKTADLLYSDFPYFPPYVEEYVEGHPSNLKFSKWELEKRMGEPEKPGEAADKEKFNLF